MILTLKFLVKFLAIFGGLCLLPLMLSAQTLSTNSYPDWLRTVVKITSTFKNHNFEEGYGVVINDGYIVTSTSLIYLELLDNADNTIINDSLDITIRGNLALGEPLGCLANAKVVAFDRKLDIAILKPTQFLDNYCNPIEADNARAQKYPIGFVNLLNGVVYTSTELKQSTKKSTKTTYTRSKTQSNVKLSPRNAKYFLPVELEWSEFGAKQLNNSQFWNYLRQDEERTSYLGSPVFVSQNSSGSGAQLLAILVPRVEDTKKNQTPQLKTLNLAQIAKFVCEISSTTTLFKDANSITRNCKIRSQANTKANTKQTQTKAK